MMARARPSRNRQVDLRTLAPGKRARVELDVGRLYDHTELKLPVTLLRGRRDGPTLLLCAAIHGDEINGVEIIRRVLKNPLLKKLRGNILAAPIVNVYGFINRARYLPDRRDLNRSFPGSPGGSLASRMASIFTRELLEQSTHVIDLHTAAIHRHNIPQTRGDFTDPVVRRLAAAFNAPCAIHAGIRDGSLRGAADRRGVPCLVYEGGEGLRFDRDAILTGVRGVIRCMHHLGMLPPGGAPAAGPPTRFFRRSTWVRASQSGIFHLTARSGARIRRGASVARITDPEGLSPKVLNSPVTGTIIGQSRIPLVTRGDALVHIAHDRMPTR